MPEILELEQQLVMQEIQEMHADWVVQEIQEIQEIQEVPEIPEILVVLQVL